MEFAKRMDMFGESVFTILAKMRQEKEKQGERVIDLSIGTPNIPPAPHVISALVEAAKDEKNYVYAIKDLDELHQAVAQWYQRRYQVNLNPDREITSLLGSQEGLAHICLSIVDPGDTVLVPDPCYPVFGDGPRIAGARLVYMPLKKENQYLIDLDDIDEEDAKKAKLMVVSYPNNPTAATAPDWFYEKLIAFARKYDIIVLHDNAYSELIFDSDKPGRSFLSYPGAKDVGVEFNSLSKTYGLAGARIGFCLGNAQVVEHLSMLKSKHGLRYVSACSKSGHRGDYRGSILCQNDEGGLQKEKGLFVQQYVRGRMEDGPVAGHHVCVGADSGHLSVFFGVCKGFIGKSRRDRHAGGALLDRQEKGMCASRWFRRKM